jgi:toluene monooxygenase electron transfer component
VTLAGFKDLTHDIREFQLTGAGPAEFLPGQYMIVELGGHRRCYSMSNLANPESPYSRAPNAKGRWDFQIKRTPSGVCTGLLFDLKPGADLTLDGPYGLAYLRPESPRDVLCLAGGSGLSPMISIVRGIGLDKGRLDKGRPDPALGKKRIHFFYGGRAPRDICGEDYLTDLPGYGDTIRFTPVVSDLDAGLAAGWTGATGFVHDAAIQALGEKIRDMEIYFAGPPPMADAVQRALMTDLKVPFGQIHYDRFF